MKILLAITKSNFGGAQRYVHDLAVAFHTAGDDVLVVCGGDGPLVTKLRAAGVRVESIEGLGRDISFFADMKAMRDFARIIRREGPDVLHINSAKIGGLGTLLGRILGVEKVIFTAHGWAFSELRPWWQRTIIRLLSLLTVSLAHRTILVSKETGRLLGAPEGLMKKTVVVYNGREDPEYLSRDEARKSLSSGISELSDRLDGRWILSIGELHPVKSHATMVAAMEALVKRFPDLVYVIIGEGERRSALAADIENRKLSDRVVLLGSKEEAARYMLAADIFVLPSRSEALPYVLIEACAAGVPIIASDVGGISEVIRNDQEGILVHPEHEKDLAHAVEHLLVEPELSARYAHAARVRSRDFTLQRMVEETKGVYMQ